MAEAQGAVPSLADLDVSTLLMKGVCPVKKEHIRLKIKANEEPLADPRSQQKPQQPRYNKKDAKERRKTNHLCNQFQTEGSCSFGDSCKFSHDLLAFAEGKGAEMPGLCPYESRSDEPCPFGIACRWTTKHRMVSEEFTKALSQAAASAPPPPDPAPRTVAGDALSDPDGSIPSDRTVALYDAEASSRVAVAELRRELNSVFGTIKDTLFKGRHDYSRANAVLRKMGCQVKHNNQGPKGGGGRGGRGGRGEGRGSGGEEGGGAEAALKEEPLPADPEPDTKRARIDPDAPSTSVGATAGDAGVAEGGAAAPSVAPSDPAPSTSVPAGAAAPQRPPEIDKELPLPPRERPAPIDFSGKTYMAPLTTNGNLPFRRLAKRFGCDITVCEMAMATNLLQGQKSEWALLKRHPSEDLFGIQICGGYPDAIGQCAQLIDDALGPEGASFVDINMGCPIDLVCNKGGGSNLLKYPHRIELICRAASAMLTCPLTIKIRKGYETGQDNVHTWLPKVKEWGVAAVTLHGRTREQRYSKLADWEYIAKCSAVSPVPLIGNGDVLSYEEYHEHLSSGKLATAMIGRGALIKPWIFTEIKERRHWDISAAERLEIYKDYCRFGLDHWGSDTKGIESTRRFLLEMMSFTHRYVPVGILDGIPAQTMNLKPPLIYGRSQLETWLASDRAEDWIQISELFLGPVPPGYQFTPKHRSNSYSVSDRDVAELVAAQAAGGAGGAARGSAAAPLELEDDGEENG